VANDDVDEETNSALEDVTVFEVDTLPAHGSVEISEDDKSITYTPKENWFSPAGEPDVFYYIAKDSSGETARFAVSVTVTSVNDLPVITPVTLPNVTTKEDTQSPEIAFTVSDVETAAGSLDVTVTHDNSTLLPAVSVTPNADGECSFTVTPERNRVGTAAFTVTVADGDGGEVTARLRWKLRRKTTLRLRRTTRSRSWKPAMAIMTCLLTMMWIFPTATEETR
jgi:hypothetical protein